MVISKCYLPKKGKKIIKYLILDLFLEVLLSVFVCCLQIHYFLCCALHNLKVPPGLSLCLVGIDHIIRIHVDLFIYNPQPATPSPGDSKQTVENSGSLYKMI